jgi:hypothetical protein
MLGTLMDARSKPRHPTRRIPDRSRLRRRASKRTLADRTADLETAHNHARLARALLRRAGAPQSYRKAHGLCKSIEGAMRHLRRAVYRELEVWIARPPPPPRRPYAHDCISLTLP